MKEERKKKKTGAKPSGSTSSSSSSATGSASARRKKTETKKPDPKAKKREEEDEDTPRKALDNMQQRKRVGNYALGKKLGKGAYGVVYKAIHQTQGNTVAVKQLFMKDAPPDVAKTLQMEIDLLKGLQHVNIVQYIDHLLVDDSLCIVMEYIENGSLLGMLRDYGTFPEDLCKTYIAKILKGLVYLHEQGVIHRDIKGANILITKDGEVKLADFGVSQNMSMMEGEEDANTPVGTPFYMAPEVIQFMGAQPQSDVWSLGCTIIELLKGEPPYFDLSPFSAIYKIVQQGIIIPKGISASLTDLLSKCFQRDPALRVSAKELLSHPWLRKSQEMETTVEDAAKKIEDHRQMLDQVKVEVEHAVRKMDTLKLSADNMADLTELLNTKDKEDKERKEKEEKRKERRKKEKDRPFSVINSGSAPSTGDGIPSLTSLVEATKGLTLMAGGLEDDIFAGIDDGESALAGGADEGWDADFQDADMALDLGDGGAALSLEAAFGDDADEIGDFDLGGVDLAARLDSVISEMADVDVFDNPFETFEEESEEALFQQQKREAIRGEIEDLLDTFDAQHLEPAKVERACVGLLELFKQHRDQISVIMSRHSLLPIIQMLLLKSDDAILALLKLLVNVIQDHEYGEEILVNLCVMGGIPNLIYRSKSHQPVSIRIAAAFVIQEICSSPAALQMFVACDGLSVLVHFLNPTAHPSEMNRIGIKAIHSFFDLASEIRIHKLQFFQVFLDYDLLDTLAGTLQRMIHDKNVTYVEKIIEIVCQFSQGTASVKQSVCNSKVLPVMLQVFISFSEHLSLTTTILKTVRYLAVCEHAILAALEIFIGPMIEYTMACLRDGRSGKDVHNHVLHCLFHLCFLNTRRQDMAAKHGMIGFLRYVVSFNNSLKEFAVPMLCDLARSRSGTRQILWKEGGLDLYLGLLSDKSWYSDGLQAIADWCAAKDKGTMGNVEKTLRKPENVQKMLDVLTYSSRSTISHQVFVNVMDSFLKMITSSKIISRALSGSGMKFINLVLPKLQHPNLYVREKLLRVLMGMADKSEDPRKFVSQGALLQKLKIMAKDDSAVVIRNLAKLLCAHAK